MFVPAIAAMGGNSGTQTSTIVVRGLASDDLAALDFVQVFFRESRVAIIVAVACGILAGIGSTVWLEIWPKEGLAAGTAPILGLAVGSAMFCAIMLSTGVGMSLPFLFRKVGIDPAIAAGPLVTTVNDAIGYITYFSLALLLLHMFS
jgi:magnesium transporter